jgi:hypothetical protein
VPQSPQNQRSPKPDERNLRGEPVTTKSAKGTVAKAMTGAPDTRRQIVQWQ